MHMFTFFIFCINTT